MTEPFGSLQEVVLPPPLPALVALLIVCGLVDLGTRGVRRLRGRQADALDAAGGFVVVAGLAGAVGHALALAGLATVWTLRPLGWALAGVGALWVAREGSGVVSRSVPAVRRWLADLPMGERIGLVASGCVLMGLGLASLGPATDADSLDYHLGVPLDWLRQGGTQARPEWFHARLTGLGEGLNLLGLASGTDALGAVAQGASLAVAMITLAACARGTRDRALTTAFVAASPVMAFLVPTQKPQLLPAAAVTLGIVLPMLRGPGLDRVSSALAFGCVGVAMGCKPSFLAPGAVALLVGLQAARWSLRAAALALGCVLVFAAPVYTRNLVFYGDPLSPFLERWRTGADPAVVAFAEFLRAGPAPVGLGRLLRLPWDLVVPLPPSRLPGVLGLGALGFVAALRETGVARRLLLAAAAIAVLTVALDQLAPRFFLAPYLVSGAAVATTAWHRPKAILSGALALQGLVAAAMAATAALILFPGALTPAQRERVMTAAASGYAETRWLDATLPPVAVLLTSVRSHALLPRRFVVGDPLEWSRSAEESLRQGRSLVRAHAVTVIVGPAGAPESPYGRLADACGAPVGPDTTFSPGRRNLLGERMLYRLVLRPLPGPGCG